MEVKYGEGLEFDVEEPRKQTEIPTDSTEKNVALEDIIRKGFRVPVAELDDIYLIIEGNSYQVFNMSSAGIGIYLNKPGKIKKGAMLKGMTMKIAEKSFHVNGRVRHMSRDESSYLCGIELVEIADECQQEVLLFLQKNRVALFS